MIAARPVQRWRVVRPFRFAGRDYRPGQLFDWRKVGCSERRLRQLADARRVQLEEEKTEQVA